MVFHSRKLETSSTSHSQLAPPPMKTHKFDANILTIMTIVLCGVACALALNAIVRLVVRCASRIRHLVLEPHVANQPGGDSHMKNNGNGLPAAIYSPELKEILSMGCAICLAEFLHGEDIRALPACGHVFHVACVDRWLAAKPTCPTCRKCPFNRPTAATPMDPEGKLVGYRRTVQPWLLTTAAASTGLQFDPEGWLITAAPPLRTIHFSC